MKKTFLISLCAAVTIFIASCTKNSDTASGNKMVTIDTTVSSGMLFLALGAYGNRAVITKQANEFLVSQVEKQSASSSPVYKYASSAKATVAQQVTLVVTDSSHCKKTADSTFLTLILRAQ